jgi:uncharacterized protein YjbI with pentapeptide repeats/menaquinone-dependent protoporphyrinogen IX oxidase
MSLNVLVAYASVSGSTAEVAQAIGDVFTQQGAVVDVQSIRQIESMAGYNAVVVGSSVRAGRWLPEASNFLVEFGDGLEGLPVAFFTTCLTMVSDTDDSRRVVMAYMKPVMDLLPELEPVGLGLFAGSLDPKRPLIAQLNPNLAPQGDYRDWAAIRAWAKEVAGLMLREIPPGTQALIARDANLSNAELSGLDWQGVDLKGADLSQADLTDTDLSDADLSETDMVRTGLSGANLQRANLNEAGLNWADLNLADLENANLKDANLIGADLSGTNLNGADLSGAIMNGANLTGANLSAVNLQYADLNWVNFSGANLTEANLSQSSLGWADLKEARLENVQLQNAVYNYYTQWPEGFDPQEFGAILVGLTRQ